MTDIVKPRRMDIWYARLPMDRRTSVQGGARPVLIISNDICNERSPVVTAIPMTTQMKHIGQPTHVVLTLKDGTQSMALAEQITTLEKRFLDRKVDRCEDEEEIRRIEAAVREQVGIKDADDFLCDVYRTRVDAQAGSDGLADTERGHK